MGTMYSKKKEADFEKGIYSYVKHRKTPSSTQHKEMIDSQKVKYKGLTNKQIVAKAMKSGNIRKLKSTESKKSQKGMSFGDSIKLAKKYFKGSF